MAISLSGTSQFYHTTTTPVTGAPLTMHFWCNVDNNSAITLGGLGDSDAATDSFHLIQSVTTQTMIFRSLAASATEQSVTSTGLTTGTWHSVVGQEATTNTRSAWIDGGGLQADTGTHTPASIDRIALGARAVNNPTLSEWAGDIFWAALWDFALTAGQVQNLADGYSPLTVQRQNLVFFARCAFVGPIDMIGNRALNVTGTPTNAADPDGVRRITGRGRGRHRMRI